MMSIPNRQKYDDMFIRLGTVPSLERRRDGRTISRYACIACWRVIKTSCARGDTICLRRLQVNNIFAFIRQVAPVPACWLLRHQQQVDLWPFDLESGIRVTCDVRYLCANFSLPRPLCSGVRPDVRDRQTDRRQTDRRQTDRRQTKASLNASAPYAGGDIINDV